MKGKRELIIEAAMIVFARDGYHKAKVGDIAETAGVGKGTIYEYFPSKKQLFEDMLKAGMELYLDSIHAVFEQPSSTEERLTSFVLMAESLAKKHIEMVKVFSQEAGEVGDRIKDTMMDFKRKMVEKIENLLIEAKVREGLCIPDAKTAAIIFLGGMNHLIVYHHLITNQSLEDIQIKEFIRLYMAGIKKE